MFNRLSTADGLNSNKINCIWQDKKGFFWIGTENGIQRFDGKKFVTFRSDGLDNSMPPIGVDQILDAGNGRFWLRQGRNIGLYDPLSFKYFPVSVLSDNKSTTNWDPTLFKDSKGNVFLYNIGSNLMCFDKTSNAFSDKKLPIKIPEKWLVNYLYEDVEDNKYYICSNKGIAVYNANTQELNFDNLNHDKKSNPGLSGFKFVYNFYIDSKKTWWIFYWDTQPRNEAYVVSHINPETGVLIDNVSAKLVDNDRHEQFDWIFETNDDQLWIGGVNTLLNKDEINHTFIQNNKSFKAEFDINCRVIKQMFEDRENNLWFCTDNGLYVIGNDQKSVFNYVFENGYNDDLLINSILETNDLESWISVWGKEIQVFDEHFKKQDVNLYKGLKDDYLKMSWSLCQHSSSGLIWAGCQNGNIVVFEPKAKKAIHVLNPPGIQMASVRQIIEDKKGDLWFGAQNGKLFKWNKGDKIINQNFKVVNDFNAAIFCLYIDSLDRIWIGTRKRGVFVLDSTGTKELFHFFDEEDNGSKQFSNNVYDIEQYNDSIFFVSNGLLNILDINSQKVKQLSQYDGLPGTNVSKLIKDKEDILWFTCNNGLGSFNYKKNIFASYTNKNGFAYAEKPAYAKFKMQNGEIWFGGENSLYGFVPEELSPKSTPFNVTLTDFKLLNKFIPLDSLMAYKKVYLKPDQNTFTIYFSSLSYSQQDRLLYYYKMDGINNDWIRADQEHAAKYTVLPPGDYTFNVKCVNLQGEESSSITSLSLIVLPQFYQTWWFIAMALVVICAITYFIYRQHINKILAVELIRNKVARDLHDDIGSTLSTINILSSMAKSKMNTDPVKTSSYISRITDNSQQMMEAMDDIVWSIKPDNDSMQKIVARMREYASGILETKDIEINFNVSEQVLSLKLNMEARRDVFLIFKEAINNIAKYSLCTKAEMSLRYQNQKLIMKIEDNGIGFNVDLADGGNGIGNMRKRAESLNGIIEIKSKEKEGTTVILNLPVNM
ncbi:hypothetical protein GCM10007962_30330 [Yeosuana aromativorans]|uniref:Histidine kinase domain-containing protein n=1 Tax=Yeosuana aromativorans TaxID=288019 RepID=A0A8J3BND1_9FLAO|nr:hypothetical protein GCM10007962_30330 [Yeosuana aromativorans]